MPRSLILTLALLATPALAANAALYQAIQFHQRGEFARGRDALAKLEADPSISEDDRVTASEYLASCQLALNDREGAKTTLRGVFRQHPDAHLDPEVFFPELIALAEQARIELAVEVHSKITEPEPQPQLVQPLPSGEPAGGLRSWGKVPLVASGALFVGAVALELGAYSQWTTLQNGPVPNNDPTPYQNTGRALQTAAQVTTALGAASLLVAGGIYWLGSTAAAGVLVAPGAGTGRF
jgi:hypothetical protein